MAALTWRNVDSPDFSNAIRGFEQFSRLIDRGITGAQNALTEFDENRTEEVSNRFMQDLLTRYAENPDQINADLQSGAIFEGVDRNRLNSEAIAALGRRPEDLLRYAAGAEDLAGTKATNAFNERQRGWQEQDRDFTISERDAAVAARPVAAQLIAAASDPNPEAAIAAVWNDPENQALLAALPVEMQNTMRTNPTAIVQGDLGLTTTRKAHRASDQNYEQAEITFANTQEDRRDTKTGQAIASSVLAQSGNQAEALLALESNDQYRNASPTAQAAARAEVTREYGSLYTGGGSTPSGSGGGNANAARIMNYEAAGAGYGSVPSNIRTLGQLSDWQSGLNREGINSSAAGVYQIVGQTLRGYAPRVFGDNWRNVNFDVEAQDQVARAIFEDNNGSAAALRSQWVSLSQADAERIRTLPWEQAREVIARGESGSSPASLLGQGASATANPALPASISSSQITTGTGQSRWREGLGREATPVEVARRLRGTEENKGQFWGVPETWLSNEVKNIVNASRVNGVATINEIEAGNILERTTSRGHRSNFDRIVSGDFGDTNLGNGYSLDRDAINAAVEDARRGGPQRRQEALDTINNNASRIQAAQDRVASVQAELDQLYQSGRPERIAAQEPRLIAKKNAALQNLAAVQAQVGPVNDPVVDNSVDAPFDWGSLFRVRRDN